MNYLEKWTVVSNRASIIFELETFETSPLVGKQSNVVVGFDPDVLDLAADRNRGGLGLRRSGWRRLLSDWGSLRLFFFCFWRYSGCAIVSRHPLLVDHQNKYRKGDG